MAIDLHLHTNHSDGSLSPVELIDLLEKYEVTTFAITDHDTISALPEAQDYAKAKGIRLIKGVELSIEYALPEMEHLHLLGLFIDIEEPHLNEALHNLRQEREKRAKAIIQKLKDLGITFDEHQLHELLQQESIGRPHIAKMLLKNGVVQTVGEAFEKYIGRNGPAYVPKKKFRLQEAIDLIHKARGLAIVAHPISLGAGSELEILKRLDELRAFGIDGVEAYYSSHDEHLTNLLIDYAHEHRLAISGGSDFHGEAKKEILPVIGMGELCIPEEIITQLFIFYNKKFGSNLL